MLSIVETKKVSFHAIEQQAGLSHLSMASRERLQKYLRVTPGAVTLLALINDPDQKVEVLIDRELWESQKIQAHPLVNTATVIMATSDMEKFIKHTGHTFILIDVP